MYSIDLLLFSTMPLKVVKEKYYAQNEQSQTQIFAVTKNLKQNFY